MLSCHVSMKVLSSVVDRKVLHQILISLENCNLGFAIYTLFAFVSLVIFRTDHIVLNPLPQMHWMLPE